MGQEGGWRELWGLMRGRLMGREGRESGEDGWREGVELSCVHVVLVMSLLCGLVIVYSFCVLVVISSSSIVIVLWLRRCHRWLSRTLFIVGVSCCGHDDRVVAVVVVVVWCGRRVVVWWWGSQRK